MIRNQNEMVINVIRKRYENIIVDLENLIARVNKVDSVKQIYSCLDNILMRMIVLFTYENRLIRADIECEDLKHLKEHETLLNALVNSFRTNDLSRENCFSIIEGLLDRTRTHFQEHDCGKEIKNILVSDIMGQKKYFGCLLLVVCEYGFFIKVYGETNEDMLSELVAMANNYREQLFNINQQWGEIIDFREWSLMTDDSMKIAKENTDSAKERNKKFTIYITGESELNEFVANSISVEAEILTLSTKNLYHTIQVMNKNEIYLGEVIALDSIGDLSFA